MCAWIIKCTCIVLCLMLYPWCSIMYKTILCAISLWKQVTIKIMKNIVNLYCFSSLLKHILMCTYLYAYTLCMVMISYIRSNSFYQTHITDHKPKVRNAYFNENIWLAAGFSLLTKWPMHPFAPDSIHSNQIALGCSLSNWQKLLIYFPT